MTINQQTCNRDGICAAVCPIGIIDWTQGALPALAAGGEQSCIRCGHCVAVCPTGSLSHRDMAMDACPPVQPELRLSAEQCEHFLRARRSIRVYTKKPVEQDKLARLIEIARYAPSGINSQGARWLVLGNREELRRLAGIVIDWMHWMVAQMPEAAQALHLGRTLERWNAGHDVILRGAPGVDRRPRRKGQPHGPHHVHHSSDLSGTGGHLHGAGRLLGRLFQRGGQFCFRR